MSYSEAFWDRFERELRRWEYEQQLADPNSEVWDFDSEPTMSEDNYETE